MPNPAGPCPLGLLKDRILRQWTRHQNQWTV